MEILTSKKFWITLFGMACVTTALILGAIGPELWATIFGGLCGLYALGQGIADSGQKRL